MKIRDLWNRLVARFKRKKDDQEINDDREPVQSLEPEEAPEPVPERKTSDEMIIAMADAAAETDEGDTDDFTQEC